MRLGRKKTGLNPKREAATCCGTPAPRTCSKAGRTLVPIQQLLGHEKLDTTAIYTEVSIKQLQEVHARCHPFGPASQSASNGPETLAKGASQSSSLIWPTFDRRGCNASNSSIPFLAADLYKQADYPISLGSCSDPLPQKLAVGVFCFRSSGRLARRGARRAGIMSNGFQSLRLQNGVG